MRDEPTRDPVEREATGEDGARPWSFDEIERERAFDPNDSLRCLHGAGLLHRLQEFYWPTRATLVAEQIKA
jgi:hypothetical protein